MQKLNTKTNRNRNIHRNKQGFSKNNATPPQRIQKVLAQMGLGSRRQIEQWIAEGRVQINGKTAVLGQTISQSDKIRANGKLVDIKHSFSHLGSLNKVRILLYHKPEGEIVSVKDPKNRPTVFAHLPRLRNAKWINVGRLDFNTSGLLLFTTSGELANRLMHPSSRIIREYSVRILGELTLESQQKLLRGVEIDGELCQFQSLEEVGGTGANRWYKVTLSEGKNREVRKLFASVNCTVSRLIRIRYGNLILPPLLRRGKTYELTPKEVSWFMKNTFDTR